MPSWEYFGAGVGLIALIAIAVLVFKGIAPDAYTQVRTFLSNLFSKS